MTKEAHTIQRRRAVVAGIAAACENGCRSSVQVTDTPQTGTWHLIVTAPVDTVIRCIDFPQLAGQLVCHDATPPEALFQSKPVPVLNEPF